MNAAQQQYQSCPSTCSDGWIKEKQRVQPRSSHHRHMTVYVTWLWPVNSCSGWFDLASALTIDYHTGLCFYGHRW